MDSASTTAARRRWPRLLAALGLTTAVATGVAAALTRPGLDGPRVANTSLRMPATARKTSDWIAAEPFPSLALPPLTALVRAPGDERRLHALGRDGTIVRFELDGSAPVRLLDLSARVIPDGDGGLLALAFHPRWHEPGPNRGQAFILYTAKADDGSRRNRVSRLQVDGDAAVEGEVLIDQADDNFMHDGGDLAFGPDGFLYVSLGDEGGAQDNAQRIDRDLFSGVLRLDVDRRATGTHAPPRQPESGKTAGYHVPDDNPFVGVPGALEEFWALGMRNPHRLSFDLATGDLWASDVGDTDSEEINLVVRGGNYQWDWRDGPTSYVKGARKGVRPDPLVGEERQPIYSYPHAGVDRVVIGGFVYRGTRHPELVGNYLFADYTSGRVRLLTQAQNGRREARLLATLPAGASPTTLVMDGDGHVWIGALQGRLFRLEQNADGAEPPALPDTLSATGAFSDLRTLAPSPGIYPYEVNAPLWSDGAAKRRWLMVPGDGTNADPVHDRILLRGERAWQFPVGTVFVKHFELPLDARDPTKVRRLETRFLVCDDGGGVYGVTYRWNEEQTDALRLDTGLTEEIAVRDADGVEQRVTWSYPSPADCLSCHNTSAGHVLGLSNRQLNRDVLYPQTGRTANQLRTFNALSFFTPRRKRPRPLHWWTFFGMSRLPAYDDASLPVADRARAYLDANCSHCHRPGVLRTTFDLRFGTPAAEQGLVGAEVVDGGTTLVVPGDPDGSALLKRVDSLYQGMRMPPLGSNVRDEQAVRLLREWITGLE